MIVKEITLNNFRQYYGNQVLKFSICKNKNVTVILGKNTSGKTTLIEAFKWCLYDNTTYKKRDLINREIELKMNIGDSKQVYVEVILIHDDREYIIRRTLNFTKNNIKEATLGKSNLKVMYKDKTGELKYIDEIDSQSTINAILPNQLSDYFFFDGERIGDIGRKHDMKSAVQGLMGLDVVTKAKDRLDPNKKNSVTSKFESELDTGSEIENKRLEKEKIGLQESLFKKNEELERIKDDLEKFKAEEKQLAFRILENKDVKENQKKKLFLEDSQRKLESKIPELKNSLKYRFSKESYQFFAIPLILKLENILDNTGEDLEAIEGMTAKAIDYLIEREKCICGCDLSYDIDALENLEKEKRLLPPYHIGTTINNYKLEYNRVKANGYDFKNTIIDDFKRLNEYQEDLEDKKKEIAFLSEKNKSNINVSKLEEQREEALKNIKKLERRKTDLNREIGVLQERITVVKRRRNDSLKVTKKNKDLKHCIAYCNEVYNWLDETYKEEEKQVKIALEENVNNIFNDMYHGKRKVEITDDYTVNLRTEVGEKLIYTDESKGLEAVKNFSFVSGLVKLAREKVQEHSGENEINNIYVEEPYPLIMDAPFSNVDEIHIENIVKIIPNVAEQVVLILMEKDWNYAKETLSDKIGYIYEINKVGNSETYSKLEEIKKYV